MRVGFLPLPNNACPPVVYTGEEEEEENGPPLLILLIVVVVPPPFPFLLQQSLFICSVESGGRKKRFPSFLP